MSIQLFGADPQVMRSAAASVAAAGADLIDINMGCPVPKVCKTGAGAALLDDPDRAVAVARAAVEGGGLPVTVKLRSGWRAGEIDGVALAHRLVERGGRRGDRVASAACDRRASRAAGLRAGRRAGAHARRSGAAQRRTAQRRGRARGLSADGVTAVMLARGALGNPWLFEELLGRRELPRRAPDEVLAELDWVIDCASEHLGVERAGRYLRRFYPWYVERLGLEPARAKALQSALQQVASFALVRELLERALDAQPA